MFRFQGLRLSVDCRGLGFRVHGSGFGVSDLGIRAQG